MFRFFTDPNTPLRQTRRNDERRVRTHESGDAGRDGYTCVSQADRESGLRPAIGSVPAWPRRPAE